MYALQIFIIIIIIIIIRIDHDSKVFVGGSYFEGRSMDRVLWKG